MQQHSKLPQSIQLVLTAPVGFEIVEVDEMEGVGRMKFRGVVVSVLHMLVVGRGRRR